mgnify:CR=1 FL=1
MIYTDFHGEKLSLLGFGTMRLPLVPGGTPADIDEKTTADMVRYAMEHGVNYFDTAYPYHGGMSERVMGRVLKDYDRGSFYLATKYPGHQLSSHYDPAAIFEEQLEKGGQNKLFVVGELGRQYFMKKDVNIDGEFSYTVQNPTLYRARHIGLQLIDEYIREELDEVYIIYTKMINAFKMEADMFQLLPLQREEYTHKNLKGYSDRMTFHPSVESVLNSLIPNVVCGFVYGALVESYASEHNSRMMAMQTATDSAKQMLHDLEIEYNRVRQAAITQEITEVIAGAKAQKSKKK